MIQLSHEKITKSIPRSERESERIKKKILNHWNGLPDAVKKDPKTTMRHMAVALDIPEPVIEQYLSEREAGKNS